MQELFTAIIKPHRVTAVKDALIAAGVAGMTITEVRGFGRQRGKTEVFRGAEYTTHFLPEERVEVLVEADQVDQVVDVIQAAAQHRQERRRQGTERDRQTARARKHRRAGSRRDLTALGPASCR